MRSVEEQLARVLALGQRLPVEQTPIGSGCGQTLAEDLRALVPVPPFNNSAMDGFAVRADDLTPGVRLPVVGDISAGATTVPTVGQGEAARIMTGAPMPPGADCVVPVELTDQPAGAVELSRFVRIDEPVGVGRHVRRAAEDVSVGDVALPAGLRWTPAAASSAASLGHSVVPLVRRPRVAVLTTGSELVAPGQPLNFGQIPDSNSVLVAGLCRSWGADVVISRMVDDDPGRFRAALTDSLAADVIVTTGGVSAGAREVVRQVVEGNNVEFTKVAMQPGKPQAAGAVSSVDGRRVPLLGLPGNPVSVFVSAWVFVRPLLALLGGWPDDWPTESMTAVEGWSGPKERRQYLPVAILGDGVRPVHRLGSGSHLVASLALADGLAIVAEGVDTVTAGEQVEVRRVSFLPRGVGDFSGSNSFRD